jgi:DNA-binding FadR family transcriptional regulator
MDVMTADQLAAVEESVVRMEELAARGEPFVEADSDFHGRLFAPLNNELLLNLLGVFWRVYRKIHTEIGPDSENLAAVAALHRSIYTAVAAGDKARASEELTRHFEGIRRRIAEAVEE